MDEVKKAIVGSRREESANVDKHQSADQKIVTTSQSDQNTENCMVCSSPLEYLEQAGNLTCAYCGKVELGHIKCPNNHYICDACHNKGSVEAIEGIAFSTTLKDPVEISEIMMAHPSLPMLGCQHAYIAAGALMAALKNKGTKKITNEDIKEVFKRTERQAIGGYCGLTGICGITPAIGAVFSVLLGSKCGKDIEQRLTMDAATRTSEAIKDLTGPSCCKAYVRASLAVATDLLKEKLGIALPIKEWEISCTYADKHPHSCRGSKCPYFKVTREVVKVAEHKPSNPMEVYDQFFALTYQAGAMDVKTKHLVALAASLAAGCQP